MKPFAIKRAAVLGAGLMGSQIAALLTRSGIAVDLFDLPGKAAEGLAITKKRRPPPFELAEDVDLITPREFVTDDGHLARADWIIEAVVEKLDVKRELFERVEANRRPNAIVSSNTSGISIGDMARDRGESFRSHFLGTHFFNPPRPMYLLEVIPTPDTKEDVTRAMIDVGERRLGKGVIRCADTPLFVANRIGIMARMNAIAAMIETGLSIEEVDAVCGPPLGRPRTGVFRLGDLVGLDTTASVASYLHGAAPNDERRDLFVLPPFIQGLLDRGSLGDKAGEGYYKKVKSDRGSEILALDWRTMTYRPRVDVESPFLLEVNAIRDPAERVRRALASDDRLSQFAWKAVGPALIYAANRIPEITRFPADIDKALRWGFGWELGLFEIWDALGVAETCRRLEADGYCVPESVTRMLKRGRTSFYSFAGAAGTCVDLASGDPTPLEAGRPALDARRILRAGRKLGNDDASVADLGDGVWAVFVHSKMNTLGPTVVDVIGDAVDRIGSGCEALVIGDPSGTFSAGANLARLLDLARRGEWKQIDRRLQSLCARLGRSGLPIVAAAGGLALGGGAEILLRSPHVHASADLNIGLVEPRVGLIPAAGGATEMLRRAMASV